MKKAVIYMLLLMLLIPLCGLACGCKEEEIVLDNEIAEELQKEGVLQEMKAILAQFREALQELLFSTPRLAHDKNLKIIDQAVELYRIVEGKDPRSIGNEGEAGTLVGDGYLESPPRIPAGLYEEEGEWSAYTLKGKPLRAWPVGDWGGYRDGDRL
ncbi:MAG: hypothetical protein AB1796_13890 [Bacillota bacterium]